MDPSYYLLLSSHVRKIPGYQCKAYLDYLKSIAASYACRYLLLSLVWPGSVRLFPIPDLIPLLCSYKSQKILWADGSIEAVSLWVKI